MLTTVALGRVYHFSHVVGRILDSGTGFLFPTALAIGQDDIAYVISRSNELPQNLSKRRVSKVAIGDPGDEELLCEFGNYGHMDGQLIWPTSVALDSKGNVYIADEWTQRVSIFDGNGHFLDKWGTPGHGDGELSRPSGMAFDQEDNLYVVDSVNNRVQKFANDGTFLAKFGEEGSEEGQLDLPWGIGIDGQGDLYVADWQNHRVQKFSPAGDFLATFGSFGTGVGELNHPTDVAIDGEGDVYVCDWANHRVQIFAPNGDVITSLTGDAQQLSKWGQQSLDANPDAVQARRRVKSLEPEWRFWYPTGVAFQESKSRLATADCQRHRLQFYTKEKGYQDPPFNL